MTPDQYLRNSFRLGIKAGALILAEIERLDRAAMEASHASEA